MTRWTAVYHVNRVSTRIDAVEVRPAQPDDPTSSTSPYLIEGAWITQWPVEITPTARVDVYQGLGESDDLTSRQLRALQPAGAIRAVMSAIRDLGGVPSPLTDLLAGKWREARTGNGHSPALLVLAVTAGLYVEAIQAGDRTPVTTVAKKLGLRQPQVRDRLYKARQRGLLEPLKAGQGRARGKLSDAAVELLQKESE
jgi:hypothetical protein